LNISKFLESIEDLVFDAASWIALLPNTVLRGYRDTLNVLKEIPLELDKDSEQRFDRLLSPLVFWILVVALPYLVMLHYGTYSGTNDHDILKQAEAIVDKSFLVKLAFVVGGVMAWPMVFAVHVLLKRKKLFPLNDTEKWYLRFEFSKIEFRKAFYSQCLVNSLPFPLLAFPVFFFGNTDHFGTPNALMWLGVCCGIILAVAAFLVFLRYQLILFELEFGEGTVRNVKSIFAGMLLSFVVSGLLCAITLVCAGWLITPVTKT